VKKNFGIYLNLYHFSHELPGDDTGAFHSSELWYTFGTLGRCWRPMTDLDYKLGNEMVTYWTNFMKTGFDENSIIEATYP
jgi:para-nitrobenzyl esterase